VIDEFGGWSFCQDLSETVRFAKASAVQIAEFWKAGKDWAVRPSAFNGAGFDLVWRDGEREAVRGCILQAAAGRDAAVNLDRVRDALRTPGGLDAWRAVQMLENHDGLLMITLCKTSGTPDCQDRALGKSTVLVRTQPLAGCNRPASRRAGRADAVHGTGVP
jgi:hypothetical protein